jgi:hypothetical protein
MEEKGRREQAKSVVLHASQRKENIQYMLNTPCFEMSKTPASSVHAQEGPICPVTHSQWADIFQGPFRTEKGAMEIMDFSPFLPSAVAADGLIRGTNEQPITRRFAQFKIRSLSLSLSLSENVMTCISASGHQRGASVSLGSCETQIDL